MEVSVSDALLVRHADGDCAGARVDSAQIIIAAWQYDHHLPKSLRDVHVTIGDRSLESILTRAARSECTGIDIQLIS